MHCFQWPLLLSHYGARGEDSHTIREAIKNTTSTVFGNYRLVTRFSFALLLMPFFVIVSYVWNGLQTLLPAFDWITQRTHQTDATILCFILAMVLYLDVRVLRRRSTKSLEWIDCLISVTGRPYHMSMQCFEKYGARILLVHWVYLGVACRLGLSINREYPEVPQATSRADT
jgi:hypothetical protein